MTKNISDIVFINENDHVEMIFNGNLMNEKFTPMLNEAIKCLNTIREKKKSPRLLLDVSGLDKISMYSRKSGADWIKSRKELNIAVYGDNLFMKYFVNMLITATNRSGTMKYFSSKDEAQNWLCELS